MAIKPSTQVYSMIIGVSILLILDNRGNKKDQATCIKFKNTELNFSLTEITCNFNLQCPKINIPLIINSAC